MTHPYPKKRTRGTLPRALSFYCASCGAGFAQAKANMPSNMTLREFIRSESIRAAPDIRD